MIVKRLSEKLRSLVGDKRWDYIVLWKLSDDHSFLEMMDCICAGAQNYDKNREGVLVYADFTCRDSLFSHPRTKSCGFLVNVPSSITLDSGVHAEAWLLNQPRWLNFSHNLDSNASEETFGTRVLVPVPLGLIELFATKIVPEDHQVIDFIKSQCNNHFLEEQAKFYSELSYSTMMRPSRILMQDQMNEKIMTRIRENKKSEDSDENNDEDEKYARPGKRAGKGLQSKNLEAERKRRKKLNDRLYSLRALVPNISKLDRSAILGDAINYVKELQKQVTNLQIELEEQYIDNNKNDFPNGFDKGYPGINTFNQKPEVDKTRVHAQQMEPQVEVFEIDKNELLVKVSCEHKAGGFVRLMEAMSSMGLQVMHVNATRHSCLVSNIFVVEKRDCGIIRADYVRESLLNLARI